MERVVKKPSSQFDHSIPYCNIEKGQFDARCKLVLACDGQRLECAAIGAAGQSLVFKRVN